MGEGLLRASAPAPENPNARLLEVYRNSQFGSHIYVYDDGTMKARNSNGKSKKTSATVEKLRQGYGAWVKVL
jgi:hypothetical protein